LKKILIILFSFSIILFGCSDNNSNSKTDIKKSPEITKNFIEENAKIGLTKGEVKDIFGESSLAGEGEFEGNEVWLYDSVKDDFDYETISETGERHKQNFVALVDQLKQQYPDLLPMGAGTCTICEKCTYPDQPCRFPDKSISSMEAYGLWVSKVCELSGIPYYYGKKTITYTSCYLLK